MWLPVFPKPDLMQCSNYVVMVNVYHRAVHIVYVVCNGQREGQGNKIPWVSAGAALGWSVLMKFQSFVTNKPDEWKVVSAAS